MMEHTATGHKRRITRSRRGCLTCRGRKVKCDETPGECQTCRKLSLACLWPMPAASESGGQDPSLSSNSGQTLAVPLLDAVRPGDPENTDYMQDLPTEDQMRQLVDLYLTSIYPRHMYAFIQRGELYLELKENGAKSLVIMAICAAAYRFSSYADPTHADGGRIAHSWARHVSRQLADRSDEVSEEILAASLILVDHEASSGRHISAWKLLGVLPRIVYAMRLDRERTDLSSPVARETRHRLFWAVYAADSFYCGGIPEFTLIQPASARIPLPVPNHMYNLGLPPTTKYYLQDFLKPEEPRLVPSGDDSLQARYLRLMTIRRLVLNATKYITDDIEAWNPSSRFAHCEALLRGWETSLPLAFQFTQASLFTYHGTGDLVLFAAIHMWYDQIRCDLYRIAFSGFRESAPPHYFNEAPQFWAEGLREAAFLSAQSIAAKIQMVEDNFGHIIVPEFDQVVFIHESIRIQLQYMRLKYGAETPNDILQASTRRFEVLVSVVRKLTKYYQSTWRYLKDLYRLLARHGYYIYSAVGNDEFSNPSGTNTPTAAAGGPVLSKLHSLSRVEYRKSGRIGTRRYGAIKETPSVMGGTPNLPWNAPDENRNGVRFDDVVLFVENSVGSNTPLAPTQNLSSATLPNNQSAELDLAFDQYTQQDLFPDISPFLSLFEPWLTQDQDMHHS